MAEVIWSGEAHILMQGIYDYIAQDDAQAAYRVTNDLYDQAKRLSDFPELGYRYANLANHQIRILLHGRYRIAYLIQPDGNVYILGV